MQHLIKIMSFSISFIILKSIAIVNGNKLTFINNLYHDYIRENHYHKTCSIEIHIQQLLCSIYVYMYALQLMKKVTI